MRSHLARPILVSVCAVSMLLAALALSACGSSTGPSAEEATGTSTAAIVYIDDATCLSCHGESYESLAATTAALGDWNPHDSIHGGYNSCVNCHGGEHMAIDSACDNCHAYAPAAQ